LFCRVSLGHILALLLIALFTLGHIVLDIMFVVSGCALRLVFGGTLGWSGSVAVPDKRRETKLDLLFRGALLVLNETPLLKSLVTFLLLLWLEIRSISKMTLLAVTVLAVNLVIVLGLFYHDNLVYAPFSGGSDGSDVERNVISTALPGKSAVVNQLWRRAENRRWGWSQCSVIVIVIVGVIVSVALSSVVAVEWESVPEGFTVT